jgi:hypothetical protein
MAPEMVERIMRERVGPNGEILPRAAGSPAPAQPSTQSMRAPAAQPTASMRPMAPARAAEDVPMETRAYTPEEIAAAARGEADAAAAQAIPQEGSVRGALGVAGQVVRGAGEAMAQGGLGQGIGVAGREVFQNPAVRARALNAAKVQLLARANPEVFSRVGATLGRAAQAGEGQYRAQAHVLRQRDLDFRKAEADATKQVERMTDSELLQLMEGQPR